MSPLSDLVVCLDLHRLMVYGASTWDWHRIHYNQEAARAQGLRGPIADGQIFGALIARQVREWAGPRARFVELEFQNRNFVVAPSTVTVVSRVASAQVLSAMERIEIVSHALDGQGRRVMDHGRTVVELPR